MVALLRGINVGRGNRVAMADLRQVAESLGWRDVATIQATGNLIFKGPRARSQAVTRRLADRLQKALLDQLGVVTRVVVFTAAEVDTIIREQPLGARADSSSRLLVAAYVDPGARRQLETLLPEEWAPEALALGTHAAYLWCPNGILASPLAAAVARVTGSGLTSRNWATWMKLSARLSSA